MTLVPVDNVEIIQGADKQFTLVVKVKQCNDEFTYKDLSAFVAGSGNILELLIPGTSAVQSFTLTANANGSKLEVLTAGAGLAGQIRVTLSDLDTASFKVGKSQNMELIIREGAGPDYDISRIQFLKKLDILAAAVS